MGYNPHMDSRYDHASNELQVYQLWLDSGVFSPDTIKLAGEALFSTNRGSSNTSKTKPFSIVMPPPNANDPLHIGHAMFVAIEDILIRYHRMLGDDTMWLPGTDHAGIETQFVFEKKLQKEGQSRFDFDRDTLYQKIWEYVQTNSDIAVNQLKKLGASADWSRFKFMLDPGVVEVVTETFFELHKAGLVYRDLKLVNYCTKCGTAFSELEVEHQDQTTKLYYVRYPFVGVAYDAADPTTYLVLATTRPEPIFVDTHLAVHPDNPKTKSFLGRKVYNPLTQAEMEIIADEFVDPEFGTGVVKLTPAHDPNDFEVAQKHHLPILSAIDTRGKITDLGGKYAGLSVSKAREQVVTDLENSGFIDHIDHKYQNRVGVCYRCKRAIEPLPLPQFFIRVRPLVEPVLAALDDKRVTIHGAGHDKILRHWLEQLRDWNISRQIVWGIRIPAWYDTAQHPEIQVTFLDASGQKQSGLVGELLNHHTLEEISAGLQSLTAPAGAEFEISQNAPSAHHLQETDTFDTWFSSGQWPYSTLKSQPGDFERFYPTQVMETAYDILMFWVMRMLMLGVFKTGQVPFEHVYLHGLVRDPKGQKMSKSKGNVVNPLDVIEQFGADALRMALVIRSSPGLDKSVGDPDFKAARNFTNKLWNAARFVLLALDTTEPGAKKPTKSQTSAADQSFKNHLEQVVTQVTHQLNDYKLGLAADTLYQEFWHWYCDDSIEAAKNNLLSPAQLLEGLVVFLTLLHPFMPFVTEAIWQVLIKTLAVKEILPNLSPVLAAQRWPLE